MKQSSKRRLVILVGAILIIGVAIAVATWPIVFSPDRLTELHQSELQPALERYYYHEYLAYKREYPKFSGLFDGKLEYFQVISYQPDCSIVKAEYSYIGLSAGFNYYLLENSGDGWEVTTWAPTIDLGEHSDLPFSDTTLPVLWSCDG